MSHTFALALLFFPDVSCRPGGDQSMRKQNKKSGCENDKTVKEKSRNNQLTRVSNILLSFIAPIQPTKAIIVTTAPAAIIIYAAF